MEQPPSSQLEKQGVWHNVGQSGCGLPLSDSAEDQVGRVSDQSGLVEGFLLMARGLKGDDF